MSDNERIKLPQNELVVQAVDASVSAWMALAVGTVLGYEYSWWMFIPLYAISGYCGWRFIKVMSEIWVTLLGYETEWEWDDEEEHGSSSS